MNAWTRQSGSSHLWSSLGWAFCVSLGACWPTSMLIMCDQSYSWREASFIVKFCFSANASQASGFAQSRKWESCFPHSAKSCGLGTHNHRHLHHSEKLNMTWLLLFKKCSKNSQVWMQLSPGISWNRFVIHINRKLCWSSDISGFIPCGSGSRSMRSKHTTIQNMDQLTKLFTSAVSCINQTTTFLLLTLMWQSDLPFGSQGKINLYVCFRLLLLSSDV